MVGKGYVFNCYVRNTGFLSFFILFCQYYFTSFPTNELRCKTRIEIDERSSNSILRKWFLSPRQGSNPQPSDDRLDALTGFDPRLGLRNHFLSIEFEDRSSTSIYPSSHVFLNKTRILFSFALEQSSYYAEVSGDRSGKSSSFKHFWNLSNCTLNAFIAQIYHCFCGRGSHWNHHIRQQTDMYFSQFSEVFLLLFEVPSTILAPKVDKIEIRMTCSDNLKGEFPLHVLTCHMLSPLTVDVVQANRCWKFWNWNLKIRENPGPPQIVEKCNH